jgi:hypothetical protein
VIDEMAYVAVPESAAELHHASATWESIECGVTERHYIGPSSEERVSFKDLQEAIEFNLQADDDDERWA